MATTRTFVFALASALILMLPLGLAPAAARGHCSELRLTCEDGRNYPVCQIAVSVAGELVTARVVTGPGRGVHVRLIPMGTGYRYAGYGIWFDGYRGEAILYRGKFHGVSCNVVHG
jgi:hypothetical protein